MSSWPPRTIARCTWRCATSYTPRDPIFLDWKAGKQFDPVERMGDWFRSRRSTLARGW